MPNVRLSSLLARLLLTCVGLASGASHAAIYTGHWDPNYGGIFPDLGWSADAFFSVPDTCLAAGDGTYAAGPQTGGPCGGFSFVSANVTFYNAFQQPRTPLETFQVSDVATESGTITIAGNTVASVSSSGFFDEFLPTATGAAASIDGGGAYAFSLIMLSDKQAQLYYGPPGGVPSDCLDQSSNRVCGRSAATAVGVFAPVPEPATTGLVVAGLAAIALIVRRRPRAAGQVAGR